MRLLWTCLCCFLAVPLWAQSSLMGRDVALQVITYDDPDAPLFESVVQRAKVSDEIEFGLSRTKDAEELDVVPVLIDIQSDQVKINYGIAQPAELYAAVFNGYVLDFTAPCDLFADVALDASDTTLPMDKDMIFWDANRLFINVQGFRCNRKSRIAIDLELNPCAADTGGKKSKS